MAVTKKEILQYAEKRKFCTLLATINPYTPKKKSRYKNVAGVVLWENFFSTMGCNTEEFFNAIANDTNIPVRILVQHKKNLYAELQAIKIFLEFEYTEPWVDAFKKRYIPLPPQLGVYRNPNKHLAKHPVLLALAAQHGGLSTFAQKLGLGSVLDLKKKWVHKDMAFFELLFHFIKVTTEELFDSIINSGEIPPPNPNPPDCLLEAEKLRYFIFQCDIALTQKKLVMLMQKEANS